MNQRAVGQNEVTLARLGMPANNGRGLHQGKLRRRCRWGLGQPAQFRTIPQRLPPRAVCAGADRAATLTTRYLSGVRGSRRHALPVGA